MINYSPINLACSYYIVTIQPTYISILHSNSKSSPISSIVPESLRWLLTQHQFSRAERMIEKATTFNELPFPRTLFEEIKSELLGQSTLQTKTKKANFLDVLRSPKLRRHTLTLVIIW